MIYRSFSAVQVAGVPRMTQKRMFRQEDLRQENEDKADFCRNDLNRRLRRAVGLGWLLVLINHAFLHDEDDRLHQADVFEGVPFHGNEISDLFGFNRAQAVFDPEQL